jgi:hypothetical protein
MELIRGREPSNLMSPSPSCAQPKYFVIWEALATSPEWVGVASADISGVSRHDKAQTLRRSAKRWGHPEIQVAIEDDGTAFVRVTPAPDPSPETSSRTSPPLSPVEPLSVTVPVALPAPLPPSTPNPIPEGSTPAASPAPGIVTPQPARVIAMPEIALTPTSEAAMVPTPPGPSSKPTLRGSRQRFSQDLDEMLSRLVAANDPEAWDCVELGADESLWPIFQREAQLVVKHRYPGYRLDGDMDDDCYYARLLPAS